MTSDAVWTLWGKAQRAANAEGPEWHPLVCHMLDVMNVAEALLDRMPAAGRDVVMRPLGGDAAGRAWLRLLVALHDAGKATPGFQLKWLGNQQQQIAAGLSFAAVEKECHRHGVSGTAILTELLLDSQLLGCVTPVRTTARALARAVAAHHGEFALDKQVRVCGGGDLPRQYGNGSWPAAHQELVRLLLPIATGRAHLSALPADLELNPGFILALTGLTSVADWLGSDASTFTYEPGPVDLEAYQVRSRLRAHDVLDRTEWRHASERAPRAFAELFPFAPRSLQVQTAATLRELSEPSLIIIESTMGDGKTEAALLVSEALGTRVGQEGLYIGLPTQATANQMLGRVQKFLERTYPSEANLQLVHGDSSLSERFQELKLRAIYGAGDSNVCAEVWFAQSKRALLASHAVGTIDQGLLGVLQVRHGFVRLFGLAGKTVVLDEVHAYDTYTSTLLDRLVEWLSVLGTTVVILSATLPKERREQLIAAYGGHTPAQEADYPRITAVTRDRTALSVATQPSRASQCVRIEKRQDDLAELAEEVAAAVERGGCVAWICNTVGRAQRAYSHLRDLQAVSRLSDVELGLFHSRFLRKDRQRLEKRAEQLYGPFGAAQRPGRGILVGTQVLEQSLDLDFDLMVSDLAPIDLILQRVGRLHRHERQRPHEHQSPVLRLIMPEVCDGLPDFRQVARVYESDVMFRTWWEVEQADTFRIPDDLELCVERVYGKAGTPPTDPGIAEALQLAREQAEEKRLADWRHAEGRLIFSPRDATTEDKFGQMCSDLEEDEDTEVNRSLRAETRLADPSTDLVCLWETPHGLSVDSDGTDVVSLDSAPTQEITRTLIEHSLKVQDSLLRELRHLIQEPPTWRRHAALRHKKLLVLGEAAACAGVRLDSDFGLSFHGGP